MKTNEKMVIIYQEIMKTNEKMAIIYQEITKTNEKMVIIYQEIAINKHFIEEISDKQSVLPC